MTHKISIEKLTHFQCGACKKWWTIGDSPATKKVWHCPWCGVKSQVESLKSNKPKK